ncbi:MAG: ribosome maturation factor RimM [Actinomycetota bacterium]
MTEEPTQLLAGQIGKPHGTAGDVYVIRISDDPHRFDPGAKLTHEDGRVLTVVSSRVHRDRFLVRFEGSNSREDAELLRGAIYVSSEEARELDDAEYWEHELVGCRAVLVDGTDVGEVTDVIVRPVQDLLEVETERGRRLIPFVEAIVVKVDPQERRVIVDPPPGLLE